MNEREYKRLKAQIEGEYHSKLKALDMVYQMATGKNGHSEIAPPQQREFSVPKPRVAKIKSEATVPLHAALGYGGLAETLRDVVKRSEGDFTLADVEAKVKAKFPDAWTPSISGALIRMLKKGQITQVKPRDGTHGAIYRKA